MAKTKAARPGSFLNSVLNQSVIDQDSKDTGFKASLLEEIEEKEQPAASEQEEKKTQKKRPAVKKPKEEAVTKEDAPAPEKKTVKKEVKKAGRPALSYNPAVTFNVNGTEYEVENPGQVKRDKLVAYVPEELKEEFTRACFANGQNVSVAINFLAKIYVEETKKQIERNK